MYKKLLLATAVAAIAGQASAASWVTTNFGEQVAVKHTAEGIDKATEADGVATSGAILSVGAQLAQNDTITFTYNIAKATNYNWPTNLYSRKPGVVTAAGIVTTDENHASGDATIDIEDDGDADDSSEIAVGDICNIGGTDVDYRVIANNTSTDDITVSPTPTVAFGNDAAIICDNPSWVKLGLINSTDTSVTYRVTSVSGGASTVGSEFAVPNPNVSVAALKAAKKVTVAYSAATASGVAMDTLATTQSLGTVIDQITYTTTTKFDATIDVEEDKKKYVDNAASDTVTKDTVGVTAAAASGVAGDTHSIASTGAMTLNTGVTAVVATSPTAVTTVVGDFTYLDDDAAAAGVTNTSAFAGTGGVTFAVAADGGSVTLTDAAVVAEEVKVTVENDQAAVLDAQSFTASTVVSYTSNGVAGTKTVDHGSAGAWALNGASVTAYAVPMGDAVSRFLWVSNNGATAADVSYTITMNGSSYGPYSIGSVAGKTSTSVGGLIDTDLAARSIYVAPSSRANINVSAPVKANDITMSASYKHIGDADRLGLETSDTLTVADGK